MAVEHDIFRIARVILNDVYNQRVLSLSLEDMSLQALNIKSLCILINQVDSSLYQAIRLEFCVEEQRQIGNSYEGLQSFDVPVVPHLVNQLQSRVSVHLNE